VNDGDADADDGDDDGDEPASEGEGEEATCRDDDENVLGFLSPLLLVHVALRRARLVAAAVELSLSVSLSSPLSVSLPVLGIKPNAFI
jgi:hypothetical protein